MTFVDTNLLVAARFVTAPDHATARASLNRIGESTDSLCISRQIIREYLAVTTRPQSWLKPLSISEAVADAGRLLSAFSILEDGPRVTAILAVLCRATPVAGRQVHDANIVATMLAHNERRLLTLNAKDFRRYAGRIELVDIETAE